jgi:hypothetical protein
MSEGKKTLQKLEATGRYVFHGTSEDIETLEPRQAIDTETGLDGPPAVFASDRIDYAIFMAIVNAYTCAGSSHSSVGGTSLPDGSLSLRYRMTRDTAERLKKDAAGWVYVFPKSEFEQRDSSAEYLSTVSVVPIQKVQVFREDLPEHIEIEEQRGLQ